MARTKNRNARDIEILAGRRGPKASKAITWGDLDGLTDALVNPSFARAVGAASGSILGQFSDIDIDNLSGTLLNGDVGDTIAAVRDYTDQQFASANQLITNANTYAENLVQGVRDDVDTGLEGVQDGIDLINQDISDIQGRFPTSEAAITQAIGNTEQRLADQVDEAELTLIETLTKLAETQTKIADAGIVVDPDTGLVEIGGLSNLGDQLAAATIRVDGVEGAITQRVTYAEMNGAISEAMLDPTQIPIVDDLNLRISDAEIELNAQDGRINLKADTTELNATNLRMTDAELAIDTINGKLELTVTSSEVEDLVSNINEAAVTLGSIDGASIRGAVTASRTQYDDDEDGAFSTIAEMLERYGSMEAIRVDLAHGYEDLQAVVSDEREARTAYDRLLTAQIDDANAQIRTQEEAFATQYQALASQITTLNATLGNQTASLSDTFYTKTDADEAIAAAITEFDSSFAGGSINAMLSQNYYTKTTADEAISAAITEFDSSFSGGSISAHLAQNYYTESQADQAIAAAIQEFETTFGDNENIQAAISDGFYTKSDADEAIATSFTNYRTANGAALSEIDVLTTTVATMEGYQSSTYSLRAKAGSAKARLEIVAADDPINGPQSAIRLRADDVIVPKSLHARHIGSKSIITRNLFIDGVVLMDEVKSALACGKTSARDFGNDGLYFGRTKDNSASSGRGYGFLAGRQNPDTGLQEYIQATNDQGLKIVNARFFRNLASYDSPTVVTSSRGVSVGANKDTIIVVACGGGAGGGTNDRGTHRNGYAGTDTVVKIYDGNTLKRTLRAPAAEITPLRDSPDGASTAWGEGGDSDVEPYWQGGSYPQAESGTYGSGGASVGGTDNQGVFHDPEMYGGNAAEIISWEIDVTGYSDPSIDVTIGTGGIGRADADLDLQGGNGGDGRVEIYKLQEANKRADVVPIDATSTGFFSTDDLDFPDHGAGWWHIDVQNNAADLGISELRIDGTSQRICLDGVKAFAFFSARTPRITSKSASRNLFYRFHKMGD